MKRNEEIEKAAQECEWISKSLNLQSAFIEGANWADKTMLDRACEWLENRYNIEKCLGILTSKTEDLSKAFRQAMEGGAE